MARSHAGFFLTIEGGDRAGKSSQSKFLSEMLRARGRRVLLTREPGGTPLGERLRHLLLHGAEEDMLPLTELFLLAADRAEHVERVIMPHLAAGWIVICDRFTDSSIAYQGYGLGLDIETIRHVNAAATGGLEPDLTLLLDFPVELRRTRAPSADRIERRDASFHHRVRKGYLELIRQYPERMVRIDASLPEAEVREQIQRVIEERILSGEGAK